jgi:predicted nucleotide-binding protein
LTNESSALALIRQAISDANDGKPNDFNLWKAGAEMALRVGLGDSHTLTVQLSANRYQLTVVSGSTPRERHAEAREAGVRRAVALLKTAAAEIEVRSRSSRIGAVDQGGPIFLVHGRNDAAKYEVARFLEASTSHSVTILHEMPNRGRTIIEKFESNGETASFAVALLTGDDMGRLGDTPGPEKARARQNVIFEAGWFMAKLGRDRVVLLIDEGLERPSDLAGVVYIERDSGGGWKLQLAEELRAAGIAAQL